MSLRDMLTAEVPYIHAPASAVRDMLSVIAETRLAPARNNVWFADSGASGLGSGKSWKDACTTINAAIALMSNRDHLFIRGWFGEDISYTTYASDPWYITIEGEDEAHDMNQWAGSAGGTPNIELSVPCWTFKNIRFIAPATSAIFKLNQPDTTGAFGTTIQNCRFYGVGGKYGIQLHGAPYGLRVKGNLFENFTATGATAIYMSSSGFALPRVCYIEDNRFVGNLSHINMGANDSFFLHNYFQGQGHAIAAAVKKLWISTGNDNVVFGNFLGGTDYSNVGGYKAGTGDSWLGNMAQNVSKASGTDAAGHTIAVPPAS